MQNAIWWSWLLAGLGVTTIFFAGRKKWWAWPIGIFTESLWIYYSIATKQHGFIVASLVYIAIYLRNTRVWRNDGN